MTNKEASNLQESRIAKYLGWNKVSASGARNFYPGDIESSQWLGECKTHTKLSTKIVFHKDVWDKISNESQSKMKYPVLFVDNGSQEIKHTYCMVPNLAFSDKLMSNFRIDFNGNTLSIQELDFLPSSVYVDNRLISYIISLSEFKKQLLLLEGYSI